MLWDIIDAFELLKEHDIRTVRSRYVDSEEDAIAFASGRPIVLRESVTGRGGDSWSAAERLEGTHKIRHAYEKIAAGNASALARVLAQEWVPEGADLSIETRADDPGGPMIHLRLGNHIAQRLCPPAEPDAEAMVDELHSGHALIRGAHQKRMLAHLVCKVGALVDKQDLTRLDLNPVRMHENEYVVLGATIESARKPRLHRRLAPDAHDRWGEEYTPSGRQ